MRDVETERANTAKTFACDDRHARARHPGRGDADDARPGRAWRQSGHRDGDGDRGDV